MELLSASTASLNVRALAKMIDVLPMCIILVDEDGKITLANHHAETLFLYSKGELLGKPVEILVPRALRESHPTLRNGYGYTTRLMEASKGLFGVRKDEREIPIEVGLNPIKIGNRQLVLCFIVDITKRKQAQEEQHQEGENKMKRLAETNAELEHFVYLASHDLQTPMRSIGSFSDLLYKHYFDILDERAKDWVMRIKGSITHLQNLIQDLLAYARLDQKKMRFQALPFEELINSALGLLESNIIEKKAKIHFESSSIVIGDRTLLIHLIGNLISNALKYCKKVPEIYIQLVEMEDTWVISVKDNGIGIEEKYFKKIFDIFQRLHDHDEYTGTGIGLAIAQRVVALHEGQLWLESTPQKGSTFYFSIKKPGGQKDESIA